MSLKPSAFFEYVSLDCDSDRHEWCDHWSCECRCHDEGDDSIELVVMSWE